MPQPGHGDLIQLPEEKTANKDDVESMPGVKPRPQKTGRICLHGLQVSFRDHEVVNIPPGGDKTGRLHFEPQHYPRDDFVVGVPINPVYNEVGCRRPKEASQHPVIELGIHQALRHEGLPENAICRLVPLFLQEEGQLLLGPVVKRVYIAFASTIPIHQNFRRSNRLTASAVDKTLDQRVVGSPSDKIVAQTRIHVLDVGMVPTRSCWRGGHQLLSRYVVEHAF
mmetsp:Transcript_16421/g.38963  ORF Transcript_16421/g.38963 Transcript_16421/m.38963 type:complete len:224 (-) Transcript_16421:837-1508(-)